MAALLSDVEMLARLVAFDSISTRSNLPIADFLADYLDVPGVEIHRNPSVDGTKVNLVIRIGASSVANDARRGLILSGHMDVVPANEPDWQSDPFTLTETPNTYVGRGTCDMKGFVALAVNLARAFAERTLMHPLVLILTFDEELGTLGAQHLARTWTGPFELPQSAIIGEPTSLRVVRMHKGSLVMRITLHGLSAHSGYPSLGKSAIEPAAAVLAVLAALRRSLQAEPCQQSRYFPETPYVALNVGTIRGGEAVNIIPDRCVITLGLRILPGMKSAPMIERVHQAVTRVVDSDICEIETLNDSPPLCLDETADIYKSLCTWVSQTDTIGASYATDAGPLQSMGLACVIFGPGSIEVAHRPNEFVPKREFAQAKLLMERAVRAFCEA